MHTVTRSKCTCWGCCLSLLVSAPQAFFEANPRFLNNAFFVFGESYGGACVAGLQGI